MDVEVSGSHVVITLRRPRANPLPKVTGSLAWTAAAIHLALTPEHFKERVVYGVSFLAMTIFQAALGWLLFSRPGARVYRVGAIGTSVLIATWIVTRAVAPPLSPEGEAEAVTALGVLATGAELATLVLLASALPVARARSRWIRWAWGTASGIAYASLVLLASGALSYVPLGEDAPSLSVLDQGLSLHSPAIYGLLLPKIWLFASWSVLVFSAIAAILVGANVTAITGRDALAPECNRRSSTLVALAPSFLAVSSCCGMPVALFLGSAAVGFLFEATPWLLLVTIGLLATNLIIMRKSGQAHRRGA